MRLGTVHVLKADSADLACVTVGSDSNAAAYNAGTDIGGANAPVAAMATTALPAVFLAGGAVCLGLLDDATHDFPTDAVIEVTAEVLPAPAGVLAGAGYMYGGVSNAHCEHRQEPHRPGQLAGGGVE